MSITKHAESHLDHNLSEEQLAFVLALDPTDKGEADSPVKVFTVEMPAELGSLPCALYGPEMGDAPQADAVLEVRGERKGPSRLVSKPARTSNKVTVVAGPHDGHDFVLFTSYGGPQAPRETFEFEADDQSEAAQESRKFWNEEGHALAR